MTCLWMSLRNRVQFTLITLKLLDVAYLRCHNLCGKLGRPFTDGAESDFKLRKQNYQRVLFNMNIFDSAKD